MNLARINWGENHWYISYRLKQFIKNLNTREGNKMSAKTTLSFEEIFNKYNTNPEEQDKQKKASDQAVNMRKKKYLAFSKVSAATDAEDAAREEYEKAVIEPGNVSFDAAYLKLESAKASTKMYRQMYTELFGELPTL